LIIESLKDKKAYFNEIYSKTGIKSKNNLLKNLSLLTSNKILIKEENKSNTFYSLNYSSNKAVALLNILNKDKLDRLPLEVRKSILEAIFILKPRIAILFGSYAKGNFKRESDIDLLFFDALTDEKEKVREISKKYGVELNITFMSLEELNLRSESLMHIFKTGYPLVGEEYFYNELEKEI
jgi:predicted nucleotidyltransferase